MRYITVRHSNRSPAETSTVYSCSQYLFRFNYTNISDRQNVCITWPTKLTWSRNSFSVGKTEKTKTETSDMANICRKNSKKANILKRKIAKTKADCVACNAKRPDYFFFPLKKDSAFRKHCLLTSAFKSLIRNAEKASTWEMLEEKHLNSVCRRKFLLQK